MQRVATAIHVDTLEALASSEYVVEAYIEASERYARFRLDGKHRHIKAAAQTLCEALQRMREDSRFIEALRGAVDSIDDETPLGDLDAFCDTEFEILTKLGLTPAAAERLLDDVRIAIERVREDGDWRDIDQLQRRIQDLADATCKAAQSPGAFRRRARATVGVVRYALPIVGGLAMAVADAAAALHGMHHDPTESIRHGLGSSLGG
jgi:hypothetical protein